MFFLCIGISPSQSRQGLAFPSRVFLVAAPLKPISIFCPHRASHLLPSPGERKGILFYVTHGWSVEELFTQFLEAESLIIGFDGEGDLIIPML